ncbi:serine/threonine-protein kinase [Nannocystis punicea]|uniref:Tetratricopeptide repeat-containing serine/threonine protein kinase n=1 Tax=Nannocystis punicea TaxID=2995304 RepID=A0ABY7H8X0_9BACT|nr:serine/threonine-protein kinase [Nannocystis poenicansa]WAS95552.1 tetratricopeptide repeat-containing serine/threonine protein kinase [Nannocystis poenicansa]
MDGDRATPIPAPPPGDGDPLGKQLVKRALFPRRAQPVQLGRFTVLKLLGQGGMGVVYACYDDRLDRKVAVKVLHREVVREQETSRKRLLREAQAMARLSHPNIVTVHEVGQADGLVYVAMEFVRGVSLDVWVHEPRSWREILSAYLQAGRGLAAAHRAGLVHRDFKPQNVMISDEGQVKVLDFGLARLRDGDPGEEAPAEVPAGCESGLLLRPLTRTGAVLGTPGYMSPEQHLGRRTTAESDQFSFCVSLYQSLYGGWPFSTESFQALREDAVHGRVAPPPAGSPVPSRVFKALRRGMMAEPAARFASMADLLAELERDPGVLIRRVAALVATAVIAGVSGVLATTGKVAVEQCPDARPELAGVWDEERAADVRTAVRAVAPARAAEILAAIEPRLERYAATWVQLRNDACRAHAEGRHSPQLFDLQTSCLDQRRAALDATVDAFALALADATLLDNLVQTVAGLPPLATCADSEALMAALPPPDEPLRARVQKHRETLALAEVHEHTAQTRLGLQLVESVLSDARAIRYEPLLAEAYLRKGSLQVLEGAPTAALQSFDEALWTAIGVGHEAVAALTSSRRGLLLAYQLRRPEQARAELRLIAALNRKVERDVEIYSQFLNNAGAVHALVGEWAPARARWEEAVALREEHGRLDTPLGVGTLFNLGAHLLKNGRYEEAAPIFHRVIALSEALSGPNHPERAMYESMLAYGLTNLGRPREALARMQELQERIGSSENKVARMSALIGLGQAALALDDGRSALQHFAVAQRTSPENFRSREWAWLMRAAAVAADVPAMENARKEALARLDEHGDVRGTTYQEVLFGQGRALASLGRLREALEPLSQARSVLVGSDDPIHAMRRGKLSLELGRLRGQLGEQEAAESELRTALAEFEAVLSPRNLELADAMLALGELALARGLVDEAVQWASRAESIYVTTAEPDHGPLLQARGVQARAR